MARFLKRHSGAIIFPGFLAAPILGVLLIAEGSPVGWLLIALGVFISVIVGDANDKANAAFRFVNNRRESLRCVYIDVEGYGLESEYSQDLHDLIEYLDGHYGWVMPPDKSAAPFNAHKVVRKVLTEPRPTEQGGN